MNIQNNPQETTNVKTKSGETVAVTGSVEIANDAGNAIPVSGTVTANVSFPATQTVTGTVEITNDVGNPIPVSGTVEITNDVGNPIPVNVNNNANVTVTNVVGNPIPATITNNPTVFAQISTTQNAVKITDGVSNVGITDVSGTKFINAILPGGNNPTSPIYNRPVGASGALVSINNYTVSGGGTFGVMAQQKIVRGTATNYYEERTADRWFYKEFLTLGNTAKLNLYDAFNPGHIIKIRKIHIRVSVTGIYVFEFVDFSGTTTRALKTRLTADIPYQFDFNDGIKGFGSGGAFRIENQTGFQTEVQATTIGWDE